jgi:hypothetical protein
MRKPILYAMLTTGLLALPLIADAQTGTLQGIVATFGSIIRALVGILFTLAIVVFFWGLVRYLFSGGEEKGKGLNLMLMGIIAIFVMASLYGIVGILQRTLGAGGNATFQPPTVNTTL